MSATAQEVNGNARPSLGDYIDVAERIAAFNARYPDGSLQTIDWSVSEIEGRTFIVYRAAAYRTPDDQRPGHGTAWEPFPGRTPYTRDSELMNAETAAWGRAIVACGLTSNRKIASLQEVRNRRGDDNGTSVQPTAAPPKQSERLLSEAQKRLLSVRAKHLTAAQFANVMARAKGEPLAEWADESAAKRQADRALDHLPARLVDAVLEGIKACPPF